MVALGSAIGGMARFLLSGAAQARWPDGLPWGTLIINVGGSLLIGALLRSSLDGPGIAPGVRALLAVGFCGGFTTFSTFSWETAVMLREGELTRAALYTALSVTLSIAATFAGFRLAR
ncbi:MAG: crcB [Gemmatimonadetes bacterium]|nr:crcB [Gemmatimonadota bacterium]